MPGRMAEMTHCVRERDFQGFGQLTMKDSNQFHATCLDTFPPISYLSDISRRIVRLVHCFNAHHGQTKASGGPGGSWGRKSCGGFPRPWPSTGLPATRLPGARLTWLPRGRGPRRPPAGPELAGGHRCPWRVTGVSRAGLSADTHADHAGSRWRTHLTRAPTPWSLPWTTPCLSSWLP